MGSIADNQTAELRSQGFTGSHQDMWAAKLREEGFTGAFNDMLQQKLRSLGFTGSLADMLSQAGGVSKVIEDAHSEFLTFIQRSYTFTRTGDQFGINSTGGLVKATTDNAAFISGEGILLEAAATNILIRSEEFDNVAWTAIDLTISADATTAPDGISTADKLIEGSVASSVHSNFQAVAANSNTQTISVFGKADTRDHISISINNGISQSYVSAVYDVSIGSVTQTSVGSTAGTLVDTDITALGNGWFKCEVTLTLANAANVNISLSDSGTPAFDQFGRPSYSGDGVSGAFAWGSQLEINTFSTSYISTAGSTATRTATSLTRAWPFLANRISGQIKPTVNFDEADDKGSDVLLFEASDGTANNYLRITFDQTNDQIHLTKRVSAGTEVVASTIATNLNYTIGDQLNIRFRANDSDGISLEVNSETRVDISTGDGTTDWSVLMDQIEVHPAFVAVESLRIWNEDKSDTFLGNLT